MKAKRAKKKPIEVEYYTFDDLISLSEDEVRELNTHFGKKTCIVPESLGILKDEICVETLEGVLFMDNTSHLIVGSSNEIYPCKIEIFNDTYDIIEEEK